MPATASEILQDVLQTLRSTSQFAAVTLGAGPDLAVPRAWIEYQGQEVFRPDDSPTGRHMRIRAKIVIRTRTQSPAQSVARLGELCESAVSALLADPYRGRRCKDLPIGLATEIDRVEPDPTVASPEAQASFLLRCHMEA